MMGRNGAWAAIGVACVMLLSCAVVPPESSPIVSPVASTEADSPTPTLECERHTASVELSATETRIGVGDVVTVTVTLRNEGCVALGMPKYVLTQMLS